MNDPVPAPKRAALRIWLGVLLILPMPLIWETATAYATRDYYNVPSWLGPVMVLAAPLLSLIGVLLLPLKPLAKALAAIAIVPIAFMIEFTWGVTFVCTQFGDCL